MQTFQVAAQRVSRLLASSLHLQGSVGWDIRCLCTLHAQSASILQLLISLTSEWRETHLSGEQNLLSSRELKHGSSQSLNNLILAGILGAHGHEWLANVYTGNHAVWATKGLSHTRGQTIGTGAGQLLVDSGHVEGVGAHSEVEAVLAAELGQVLVGSDTASLESLRGELLSLIRHKVHYEREVIDWGLLVSNVVNADLGVCKDESMKGMRVGEWKPRRRSQEEREASRGVYPQDTKHGSQPA
jgi:hypothetical protein